VDIFSEKDIDFSVYVCHPQLDWGGTKLSLQYFLENMVYTGVRENNYKGSKRRFYTVSNT
jgi:hypothetical protein